MQVLGKTVGVDMVSKKGRKNRLDLPCTLELLEMNLPLVTSPLMAARVHHFLLVLEHGGISYSRSPLLMEGLRKTLEVVSAAKSG